MSIKSKFGNLDTDITLGGNNAQNDIIPSQLAIKTYVDNNKGPDALSELNDVTITEPAQGQTLTYDATNNKWVNSTSSIEVNDSTITFVQAGVTKGSFTLNQSSDATITLDGTTGNAIVYETHGTTSEQTDTLPLNTTLLGKNQIISVNVGNTIILPTLWSLNTEKNSVVLQNSIDSGVLWSIVYVQDYSPSTLPIVTSIDEYSTDSQIPSAKCMYDMIGNLEDILREV